MKWMDERIFQRWRVLMPKVYFVLPYKRTRWVKWGGRWQFETFWNLRFLWATFGSRWYRDPSSTFAEKRNKILTRSYELPQSCKSVWISTEEKFYSSFVSDFSLFVPSFHAFLVKICFVWNDLRSSTLKKSGQKKTFPPLSRFFILDHLISQSPIFRFCEMKQSSILFHHQHKKGKEQRIGRVDGTRSVGSLCGCWGAVIKIL